MSWITPVQAGNHSYFGIVEVCHHRLEIAGRNFDVAVVYQNVPVFRLAQKMD